MSTTFPLSVSLLSTRPSGSVTCQGGGARFSSLTSAGGRNHSQAIKPSKIRVSGLGVHFLAAFNIFGACLSMLWLKSFHIVMVVSWFAGLFYLPRIFVNLAMETNDAAYDRLLLMAGKLYRFVSPIMWLTLIRPGYGWRIFRLPNRMWAKLARSAGWSAITMLQAPAAPSKPDRTPSVCCSAGS
jgi:hypothetical protein